jgi:hypothetical protein
MPLLPPLLLLSCVTSCCRSWEVSLRQLALWVAFWTLVLFYAPVVALIQAPVNMDNLMKVTRDCLLNIVLCNIHATLCCT